MAVNIRAHFDGQQILLDEPFPLQPNTKLIVTVLPEEEDERDVWTRFGLQNLERAYGPDEPDYSLELVKRANPDYDGR
ncbi:MAG TPA: hypothetical protein VFI31_03720 [Pirellulales bacterium]|nr:hypothetical protein [Pirellulales bacterium]